MEDKYVKLIQILKSELVMALGCTEPGAAAYGAAAASILDGKICRVKVLVSSGIFKNGATTFIPSTGKRGLSVAAALGAVIAEPEKELMILGDVKEEHLTAMNELLDVGAVTVEHFEGDSPVYVEAWVDDTEGNTGHAIISGNHNNLVLIEKNGTVVRENSTCEKNDMKHAALSDLDPDMDEILCFIENVPLQELHFINDSIRMNWEIAQFGISSDHGLKIGKTLKQMMEGGICAEDIISYSCMLTTAAVDVRMGGCMLPAMACGGSGNQGILASVPIIAAARKNAVEEDRLLRSLALSYLMTIYTKKYLGKLSILCGCSTAAGIGCTAGLTWMLGGDRKRIKGSIHNLLAGLSGMICDGAKEGCSFKIMSAVLGIMQSSLLALQGVMVSRENGIIGITEKETIGNLKSLSQEGMAKADQVIIEILKDKFKKECVM